MLIPFRTLLKGAFRDHISLFYGTLFPIILLVGIGSFITDHEYRRHLLAGMLAFSVLSFSLSGVAFEALAQRNQGVYKLLRATPYHTSAFVANLTVARGAVSLLSCLAVLLAGMLIYGIHVSWVGVTLLLPFLGLAAICFTCLGLALSNFAQNEGQTAILNNIVMLPMVFGSETFYSLGAAPEWVRVLSAALPFSHVLDGLRAALDGDAGAMVMPGTLLLGYTALALILAIVTFRWDPDAAPFGRRLKAA